MLLRLSSPSPDESNQRRVRPRGLEFCVLPTLPLRGGSADRAPTEPGRSPCAEASISHLSLERPVARIGLYILEAGISVGKVLIFARVLRGEAGEPLNGPVGIVSAGIERRDSFRVIGIPQFVQRDCLVRLAFAPRRIQCKRQNRCPPLSVGFPLRLNNRLGRLMR